MGGESTRKVLSGSLQEEEEGELIAVVEEVVGDLGSVSGQDMVVEHGSIGPKERRMVGKCVVVIAERLASWLLLLDGRLPADLHFFISKEASWLRNSTGLRPIGCQYMSIDELACGSWAAKEPSDVVFLLQGSGSFCSSAIVKLGEAGATSESRMVLVASSGNVERSAVVSFDLLCTTVRHHMVGGVTSAKATIACSRHMVGSSKLLLRSSSIRRSLVKQLKGDIYGTKCAPPPAVPALRASEPFDPRVPVRPSSLLQ